MQTLPTLCTLGNVICGFAALNLCLRAMWISGDPSSTTEIIARNSHLMERLLPTHIAMAAYLVFLSMVFDALDGRLARWTRHTTDFGAQLDSLADIVSFGIVPPMIVITLMTRQSFQVSPFGESMIGRIIWVIGAVYVACAALRLARFNVENEPVEQAHQTFRGLPSPGAAAAIAAIIILHEHVYFFDKGTAKVIQGGAFSTCILWSLPFIALCLGLLMVSRFPYVHLVNKYLRRRRTFTDIIKFIFILVAIAIYPEITLGLLILGYALSGPLSGVHSKLGFVNKNKNTKNE